MIRATRAWPADRFSEAETLLLRAAGLDDPESALSAWRRFRALVPEGEEDKSERRLLPLVCRNLRRAGHSDPGLNNAYANAVGANARILGQTAPALRALAESGIPTLVLKGTALLVAHYKDLGARPMSDVDVLVPAARITEAIDRLESIGWRGEADRSWLRREAHADTIASPEGLSLDLHRYATYEARYAEANEGFFAAASPALVSGVGTLAMSAADQLLHTVVHGLRWSIARSPIWVADAQTLLRNGGVNAQAAVERAHALSLGEALRRGLQQVRTTLGESDTLLELLARLGTRGPLSERVEHWFRVREPRGPAGALPNLWFAYRRGTPGSGARLSGFGGFLRSAWRMEPEEGLTSRLLAKARRRISGRRG